MQRAACKVQGADDVQRIEERPENKLRLTIKTEDELEDDNNNRLNAR